MQQGNISGQRNFGQKSVELSVPLFHFIEDDTHYAYIPVFDLTGYGRSEDEAMASIQVVLDEFLRYTLNKNTLVFELQRLGWKIKGKKTPMTAPQMSDLIHSNEQLRDIINHKQFRTSHYSVNVPAYA